MNDIGDHFCAKKMYHLLQFPVCEFTHTINVSSGDDFGAIAIAEFSEYTLPDGDLMLTIGSDGVFGFISLYNTLSEVFLLVRHKRSGSISWGL